VDGITRKPALSTDNLSLEANLAVLETLRAALRSYLVRRAQRDGFIQNETA